MKAGRLRFQLWKKSGLFGHFCQGSLENRRGLERALNEMIALNHKEISRQRFPKNLDSRETKDATLGNFLGNRRFLQKHNKYKILDLQKKF